MDCSEACAVFSRWKWLNQPISPSMPLSWMQPGSVPVPSLDCMICVSWTLYVYVIYWTIKFAYSSALCLYFQHSHITKTNKFINLSGSSSSSQDLGMVLHGVPLPLQTVHLSCSCYALFHCKLQSLVGLVQLKVASPRSADACLVSIHADTHRHTLASWYMPTWWYPHTHQA